MSESTELPKAVSRLEQNAARISIASGVLFVLLLGSLHFLESEFDPTWRFISEYALGNFGWMMSLAFVALAVSLASAGAAVFSRARNIVGIIGLALLLLAVIGLMIAASFKTDPIFTPRDEMTSNGQMHVLGASLDYSPVAFLLISFSLARHAEWFSAKKWLFLASIISIALTIGFILTIPMDGVFGPGVYSGLVGRFLLLSYLGWLGTATFHILKLRNQEK